jgi:hypothetical protein
MKCNIQEFWNTGKPPAIYGEIALCDRKKNDAPTCGALRGDLTEWGFMRLMAQAPECLMLGWLRCALPGVAIGRFH